MHTRSNGGKEYVYHILFVLNLYVCDSLYKLYLHTFVLKVNIKEPQYTNAIEAFLSGRDFYSFVTQNQEDMETFLREVRWVHLSKIKKQGEMPIPINILSPIPLLKKVTLDFPSPAPFSSCLIASFPVPRRFQLLDSLVPSPAPGKGLENPRT